MKSPKIMNEILNNLARLNEDQLDKPQGVDALYLDAIHIRAFLYALDRTEKKSFEESYLFKMLIVGSTYSIVFNIMKLYDRDKSCYQINTLRRLWKKVGVSEEEASFISNEFDTRNKFSIFQSLKVFRDKSLAHNEQVKSVTWEQIDETLFFLTRVWNIVGKYSDSIMIYPFLDFERVSGEMNYLFSDEQICNAKNAWDEYMSKIKIALDRSVGAK